MKMELGKLHETSQHNWSWLNYMKQVNTIKKFNKNIRSV